MMMMVRTYMSLDRCPPCRTSIPHLTELAHRYADTVSFVGVTNESAAVARPFVQKMGDQMDYNVACDPKGVSQRYLQVSVPVPVPVSC